MNAKHSSAFEARIDDVAQGGFPAGTDFRRKGDISKIHREFKGTE